MCWRPAPCNHDRALRYALPLDPRTGENEFTEINDTISTKLHEAGIPWTATSIQDRDLFSSRIIPGTDNKSAPYVVTVPHFYPISIRFSCRRITAVRFRVYTPRAR